MRKPPFPLAWVKGGFLAVIKAVDFLDPCYQVLRHYGETETNPNDYLGVFSAKTSIKDRLDFKLSLH